MTWCVYLYIYQPGRAARPVGGSREKRAQDETSSASLSPIVYPVNPPDSRLVETDVRILHSQILKIMHNYVDSEHLLSERSCQLVVKW